MGNRLALGVCMAMGLAFGLASHAEGVQMEKVAYGGWANCIRLSNGSIELIATTDVGPRLIRFGFVGGQNIFKEYPEQMGKTGDKEWVMYGGSRLWHAPEVKPRTYWPDNDPVQYEWDGKTLKLLPPVETGNGLRKEIHITMAPDTNKVTVLHRIVNVSPWDMTLSPWVLTVMAAGGRAIFPQEEFREHVDYLLPARPLVLWHYTQMADPRWIWGNKYIQLKMDPTTKTKQKLGLMNKQGWAAYVLNGEVFIKHFPFDETVTYPDYGCNTETFTDWNMLEVESLGPLKPIPADGGFVDQLEVWTLDKLAVGEDEAEIDAKVLPLVEKGKK